MLNVPDPGSEVMAGPRRADGSIKVKLEGRLDSSSASRVAEKRREGSETHKKT